MHNVPKWSDKCCKIFKVCLTILGNYALKGSWPIRQKWLLETNSRLQFKIQKEKSSG